LVTCFLILQENPVENQTVINWPNSKPVLPCSAYPKFCRYDCRISQNIDLPLLIALSNVNRQRQYLRSVVVNRDRKALATAVVKRPGW